MKFKGLCILTVLLASSLNFVSGHSYHLDQCPDFDPMPEFVMDKLLGSWYAVQETPKSSPCLVYEFTQEFNDGTCTNCTNCVNCVNCTNCINCTNCTNCTGCSHCNGCQNCTNCKICESCTNCTNCSNLSHCTNRTNQSNTNCSQSTKFEQIIENFKVNVIIKANNNRYVGQLKADKNLPSRMTSNSPLNVAGKSYFVVFATDYVNYAGVYTCQKKPFGHKHSITILSRSKVLDKTYLNKMHNLMASVNVSPYDLSIVDQSNCNHLDENISLEANDQQFNPKNMIAGTKAGENLGQAVGDKKVHISMNSLR
ncbi:uncharacterized protein LOC126843224 [Adelges cooleyi]|uniref:uncharacterized protein LOC126843224 n=1 Tax=Adelges cooleyi TaxID=133065 RepID=UPI00217F3411|nr:uncharacterized protein LOC126843224 [Adelges cooleyi]